MFHSISIAITYFNSSRFIQDSLYIPLMDPRVSEIVIFNDGSNNSESKFLRNLISSLKRGGDLEVYKPRKNGYVEPSKINYSEVSGRDGLGVFTYKNQEASQKITLVESKLNLGAYMAKHNAISKCKSDWVLLLDSDNHLIESSLDSLFALKDLSDDEMLLANIALMNRPANFPWDYWNNRKIGYDSLDLAKITKSLVSDTADESIAHLLNMGNMLINKNRYLLASEKGFDLVNRVSAKDATLFSACWLFMNNKIRICPGYIYFHRLHPNSYWMRNLDVPKLSESEIFEIVSKYFD